MKKIICMLVSSFLILCTSPISAQYDSTLIKDMTLPNQTVIRKHAKELSPAAKNILEEEIGVISDDAFVEILPVNETGDTAVCLSTQEGNIIKKDICLSFTESDGKIIIDNALSEMLIAATDSSTTVTYRPNSTYTVYATAIAATYIDNNTGYKYYKPYHCEFYYIKHSDVTVSSILARYTATGSLCTYPGYVSLNETYTHIVPSYASFPTAGVTYSNEKYFATDRVLDTTLGSIIAGQYIDFYNKVNGQTHEYNIRIS